MEGESDEEEYNLKEEDDIPLSHRVLTETMEKMKIRPANQQDRLSPESKKTNVDTIRKEPNELKPVMAKGPKIKLSLLNQHEMQPDEPMDEPPSLVGMDQSLVLDHPKSADEHRKKMNMSDRDPVVINLKAGGSRRHLEWKDGAPKMLSMTANTGTRKGILKESSPNFNDRSKSRSRRVEFNLSLYKESEREIVFKPF